MPADLASLSVKSIGRFVRERRKANGLRQQELGELANVGTRFVSEFERGKPTVRVDAVNRVLAVFGKMLGVTDAPRECYIIEGDDPDFEHAIQ